MLTKTAPNGFQRFLKLCKYDFLYGWKMFTACAVTPVIYAVAMRFVMDKFTELNIPEILVIVLSLIPVMIPIVCLVLILNNYQKSLFSSQGYLTLTLPVKTREILLSKTVVPMVWFCIISLVGTLSVLFIGGASFEDFTRVLTAKNLTMIGLIALTVILFVLNFIHGFYIAISLTYTALRKIPKVIASILALGIIVTVEVYFGKLLTWFIPHHSIAQMTDGTLVLEGSARFHELNGASMGYSSLSDVVFLITLAVFTVGLYAINLALVKKKINIQ